MRDAYRHRISIIAGVLVLALLLSLTITSPLDSADLLPAILFCVLIVFTMTFGIPVGGGSVSLMPMTVIAAYLVTGSVWAGWATYLGDIIHGWVRYRWMEPVRESQETSSLRLVARTATNATMHTVAILAAGVIFELRGGTIPLDAVDASTFLTFVLVGLTALGVNHLIAGIYIASLGRAQLNTYLRSLHKLLVFEGIPLIFALLMALTYTQLGLGYFVLFAVILVAGSLIVHNLDLVNRRLGRRVKELDSLQAVGQALSASLDIENVVSAIYSQVAGLMPARGFYVALYNSQTDEVEFPLAIEEGKRVTWRSRQAGNGLTEYVLRAKAPLLIRTDVKQKIAQLGLDQIGREAVCWLGVPILSGAEPLGVVAVQSYNTPKAYDSSHERVLATIAAQAAVAIQNARLYARTDESLSRRVQELASILRSTRDGIMLLDLDWQVLTVNRTLVDWLNVPQSQIIRESLCATLVDGDSLVRLIGYTPQALEADLAELAEGKLGRKQAVILLGPSMRHVERTLVPVRDKETIAGWLLDFRDMTEEIELARLRDDMTDMLVHDLRSPLTGVMSSVALMERSFDEQDQPGFERLRVIAQHNTDRILRIVNQLLDISRLESDQMPLKLETVDLKALFRDVEKRFAPMVSEAEITFTLQVFPDTPSPSVDPALVSRVLDNLLDNAVKFTPDGGQIRLWARRDSESTPQDILLGVSDTGPGIPPEAQARIFEKFQQIASIKGRRRGTGLGLAFCRLAIEAHGGHIWVESEVGQGSTFFVALPLTNEQL